MVQKFQESADEHEFQSLMSQTKCSADEENFAQRTLGAAKCWTPTHQKLPYGNTAIKSEKTTNEFGSYIDIYH